MTLYEVAAPRVVKTAKDVPAGILIERFAQQLKKGGKMVIPEWVDHVKTSSSKELPPQDPDWLYIRAASILRHLYIRPNAGVGALSKFYGRKQRNGTSRNHSSTASRGLIRYCLLQLQGIGLVEFNSNTGTRRLSAQGQRELDSIATQCRSSM
ncbi:putative 40S ribosomal protein S19 [Cryptosporidium serpentis]